MIIFYIDWVKENITKMKFTGFFLLLVAGATKRGTVTSMAFVLTPRPAPPQTFCVCAHQFGPGSRAGSDTLSLWASLTVVMTSPESKGQRLSFCPQEQHKQRAELLGEA